MNDELRGIASLIRQRQPADARRTLARYVQANPESAEAWYLLSWVAAGADERVRAAQKAAALDPSSARYGERLARLMIAEPRPRRLCWPLLAVPVALILIGITAVWAIGSAERPAITLPTQAVFVLNEAEMAMDAPASARAALVVTEPPGANTETAAPASPTVRQPARESTPAVLPPPAASPITAQPAATREAAAIPVPVHTTIPNAVSPTNGASHLPPTNLPPATNIPTTVPSPATVIFLAGAVPLREGVGIGTGEMRVVDALRQAGAQIRERGGSAGSTPPGEEWVLVEVLLMCAGDANCAPDLGAFSITGTSGRSYSAAAGFALEPVFGRDAFVGGQVWGYLGFVVPNSESGLWLTVGQGNAVYRFALQ